MSTAPYGRGSVKMRQRRVTVFPSRDRKGAVYRRTMIYSGTSTKVRISWRIRSVSSALRCAKDARAFIAMR
jgi:hypothetical protein